MKLFSIDPFSIPLGKALDFSLRNEDGVLLARKGHLFFDRRPLHTLMDHGKLYVDVDEAEAYQRTIELSAQMSRRRNEEARAHAAEKSSNSASTTRARDGVDKDGHMDWLGLQVHVNHLLRHPESPNFLDRLEKLQGELDDLARRNPDTTLLALIYLTAQEGRNYSATHAMLVCVMCTLAARDVLEWPEDVQLSLAQAALTMNISMTELQDRLVAQRQAPTIQQRSEIDSHARRSVEVLMSLGVSDPVWLGAVAGHHDAPSGSLQERPHYEQVARLIQRADVFAARLSARASRSSMLTNAAMKATYLDEESHVDEAGAALLKAFGIYHPGALVRLANNEVAIVVRRGVNTLMPTVAVLVNRRGLQLADPVIRDTRMAEYRIVSHMSYTDIKVRTDLLRLLAVA